MYPRVGGNAAGELGVLLTVLTCSTRSVLCGSAYSTVAHHGNMYSGSNFSIYLAEMKTKKIS